MRGREELRSCEDKRLLVVILSSLACGITCMIAAAYGPIRAESLLSVSLLRTWASSHPWAFKVLFDALIWQWATGAAFLVFYYRDWREMRGRRYAGWRTSVLFIAMLGTVVAMFLARQEFLRFSWRNFTPETMLGEGIATTGFYSAIEWFGLRVKQTAGLAASSGFVSLQVMLLLGMWLHSHKRRSSAMRTPWWWIASGAALVIVAVSRLLLGGHTVADILLGAAIGAFVFWGVFAVVRAAIGQLGFLVHMAIPALSYFLVGLFFCHDPLLWLWLGFGCASGLALLLLWFGARPPLAKLYDRYGREEGQ